MAALQEGMIVATVYGTTVRKKRRPLERHRRKGDFEIGIKDGPSFEHRFKSMRKRRNVNVGQDESHEKEESETTRLPRTSS